MKKRKEKTRQEKRLFSNKQLITISFVLVAIIIFGFIISSFLLQTQEAKFSLKAAIIDQLGEHFSNPQFVNNITDLLETAGFNVTYHGSLELDVNFFKELAKSNYGVIILRVHSALRDDASTVDLFTSEKFSGSLHVEELNKGLLVKGVLNYSQIEEEYFALTSKFIESLEGTFPKSIIIAMGCWSLKPGLEQIAEAFIKKGATVYTGWTKEVDLNHTDSQTVKLLSMLLKENKTMAEAEKGITPDWRQSKMKFYPESVSNLTISSLIAQVTGSSNYQSSITLFESIFTLCIYKAAPKLRKRILSLAYVKLAR